MFSKYFSFAYISGKQSYINKYALLGRVIFLGIILYIFSKIWSFTGAIEQSGFNKTQMIWYLMFTECIVIALPATYLAIENDLKNGSLMYQLIRPISYLQSKFFEALGDYLIRGSILITIGMCYAFLMTKSFPSHFTFLLAYFVFFALAGSLGIIMNIGIGIASFWIVESTPFFWAWQKLLFVFGGMILPLTIYPEWMQTLANFTPFPAMLSKPAMFAIGGHETTFLYVILTQIIWCVIFMAAVSFLFRRAIKNLSIMGG